MSIAENLKTILGQIRQTGRPVQLIAVSKMQPVAAIREAAGCGQRAFGENYVQELVTKAEVLAKEGYQLHGGVEGEAPTALPAEGKAMTESRNLPKGGGRGNTRRREPEGTQVPIIAWHFIGHLQRNKVNLLLPWVSTIHSIDSLRLAEAIAGRATRPVAGFVEVNVGGETSKTGLPPGALPELLQNCSALPHLEIKGLMGIPPPSDDPEVQRGYFTQIAAWQARANAEGWYKQPLTELSMGMSHDFRVAIACGATYVRVGSAIFGERVSS